MPSGVFDSTLLKHLWGTEELRAVFNDENRVQKWYDYEAALALSQAELGIIPQAAAVEIAAKAKLGNVDLEHYGGAVGPQGAAAVPWGAFPCRPGPRATGVTPKHSPMLDVLGLKDVRCQMTF